MTYHNHKPSPADKSILSSISVTVQACAKNLYENWTLTIPIVDYSANGRPSTKQKTDKFVNKSQLCMPLRNSSLLQMLIDKPLIDSCNGYMGYGQDH